MLLAMFARRPLIVWVPRVFRLAFCGLVSWLLAFVADDNTDPTKRAYFLAFKKSATDSTKLDFLTYVKVTSEEELDVYVQV
jgi:hypothetical protein